MLLGDYFHNIKNNYKNFFFSGISFDSNQVKKNYIFFAIKGNSTDGNNFVSSAIKNGAKIIVTEKKINRSKKNILFIQVRNVRKKLAEISFKIQNKIPNNIIADKIFSNIYLSRPLSSMRLRTSLKNQLSFELLYGERRLRL